MVEVQCGPGQRTSDELYVQCCAMSGGGVEAWKRGCCMDVCGTARLVSVYKQDVWYYQEEPATGSAAAWKLTSWEVVSARADVAVTEAMGLCAGEEGSPDR